MVNINSGSRDNPLMQELPVNYITRAFYWIPRKTAGHSVEYVCIVYTAEPVIEYTAEPGIVYNV